MSARPLTHKQNLFCRAYVGEAKGNGTESARIAGYAGTDATLASVAAENLRKPHILAEITRLTEEAQQARGALSPAEIRQFWGEIARDPKESSTVRLTALRDAARASGLFLDRTHHTASTADLDTLRSLLGIEGE